MIRRDPATTLSQRLDPVVLLARLNPEGQREQSLAGEANCRALELTSASILMLAISAMGVSEGRFWHGQTPRKPTT